MEVDTKNEVLDSEALLLGGEEGTDEKVDFSHGDVELLLGDDDVNAFANESFETSEGGNSSEDKPSDSTTDNSQEENSSKPVSHQREYVPRGRGGRGYFHRGRGFGPPPGFFPRGGLRPPFPGTYYVPNLIIKNYSLDNYSVESLDWVNFIFCDVSEDLKLQFLTQSRYQKLTRKT